MKAKGLSNKGWHNESMRHSQAAKGIKSGRSFTLLDKGGKRISPVFEYPSQAEKYHKKHLGSSPNVSLWEIKHSKNISNKEFLNSDFDGDGVINKDDCFPYDKKRQDISSATSSLPATGSHIGGFVSNTGRGVGAASAVIGISKSVGSILNRKKKSKRGRGRPRGYTRGTHTDKMGKNAWEWD